MVSLNARHILSREGTCPSSCSCNLASLENHSQATRCPEDAEKAISHIAFSTLDVVIVFVDGSRVVRFSHSSVKESMTLPRLRPQEPELYRAITSLQNMHMKFSHKLAPGSHTTTADDHIDKKTGSNTFSWLYASINQSTTLDSRMQDSTYELLYARMSLVGFVYTTLRER
jgi:hypothetical protein